MTPVCFVNCPFCNTSMDIPKELINQIVLCPNCKEELCFSEEDFIEFQKKSDQIEVQKIEAEERLEAQKTEELKQKIEAEERLEAQKTEELKQKIEAIERSERTKTEYRFLILKIEEIESTLNRLWLNEGWHVVSQSTVFLSEQSLGIGSFTGSTRTEGIAYTLKRERKISFTTP